MPTNAAYHKAWYYRNVDKSRARYRGYYHNGRAYLTSTKIGKSCADCGGVFHVEAMQYDHVGSDKRVNISQMSTWSRAAQDAEIAKCDLVCANCHAVRTFKRRQRR